MSAPRGLFVTGTDTGVGKTVVACGLVRAFADRGIDVAAMKPIETGVEAAGPLDALALQTAAGAADSLDDICPQRFALAAAPNVAAELRSIRTALSSHPWSSFSVGPTNRPKTIFNPT